MSFYTDYCSVREQRAKLTDNEKVVFVIKIGDFFEAFDDDAKTIAKVCGLNLLSRHIGRHGQKSMTGYPSFSAEKYIAMLNAAGYTVAAVERIREIGKV